MLKDFLNNQGVKKISREEQLKISGGYPTLKWEVCTMLAQANANIDGEAGGYFDDPTTMATLFNEHFLECFHNWE